MVCRIFCRVQGESDLSLRSDRCRDLLAYGKAWRARVARTRLPRCGASGMGKRGVVGWDGVVVGRMKGQAGPTNEGRAFPASLGSDTDHCMRPTPKPPMLRLPMLHTNVLVTNFVIITTASSPCHQFFDVEGDMQNTLARRRVDMRKERHTVASVGSVCT